MEEAKASGDVKAIKRAGDQMAYFMHEFCRRLNAEIPIYRDAFKRGVEPFTRAMSMVDIGGETDEQMLNATAAIETLIATQEKTTAIYRGLRDTIANLPRITTEFNRARRHSVTVLDRLIEEFEKSLRLSGELHDIMVKRRDGVL
jgi:hypothetical protein